MENQNTKERLARPRSTLADVTGSINWDILEWLLFMQEARHNSCKLTSALEKQGPGICFCANPNFCIVLSQGSCRVIHVKKSLCCGSFSGTHYVHVRLFNGFLEVVQ